MIRPSVLTAFLLSLSSVGAAAELSATAPLDYSFISGSDLRDALSQDSMVLKGYMLGVADALKHSADPEQCFVIPNAADADVQLQAAYIAFWGSGHTPPDDAVTAITQAFTAHFPCAAQ